MFNQRGISTMKARAVLLVLFVLLLPPGVDPARADAASDIATIGVVTGSPKGTYIQFGRDMARIVQRAGLSLDIKESQGSLDNIRRINSKENAAFGIVQSDVLSHLNRSEDPAMRLVAKRLRMIFPFYNEEVHVFARRDVKTFRDLEGKRVVVGNPGSGTWLTATNLLTQVGVNPGERLALDPHAAVKSVLTGDVDAMFYVAGKPVQLFATLARVAESESLMHLLDQVHFVPLEELRFFVDYERSALGPADYGWMDHEVATVAVKAVLVSFDFSKGSSYYYRMRCSQLARLGHAVRSSLEQLRATGHPKWQEVDLDESGIGMWEPDRCSRNSEALAGEVKTQLDRCLDEGKC